MSKIIARIKYALSLNWMMKLSPEIFWPVWGFLMFIGILLLMWAAL